MKRTLSFIMVLAMVLSMIPAVYAETAEAVVITSGTDVAVTVAEPATYTWTAESNGTLTVTMGAASPGWRYTVSDAAGNTVGLPKSGKTEISNTHELVAGTEYTFRATGWSSSAWEETAATLTYTLSFVASADSGEVVKEEYEVSETALALGDNTVSLLDTAITTIYVYEPTETGVFTFTAPEGAILGYWGAGSWFLSDPQSTTNTYEWTCTGVGQSAYIGVSGVEGSFNLNVAKTGDYEVVEAYIVTYENKATLESFTLPEGSTLGSYIDVTAETVHTAVLGDDGYYHLNSADGDIILVDLNYQDIILSNALKSDRPVMYVHDTDEEGKPFKHDIGAAVQAYEAVMDENGYYPLTEDLIFFYDDYANGAAVYSFYVTSAYNPDNIWMYCMRTVTFPEVEEPDVTEPEPTDPPVEDTSTYLTMDMLLTTLSGSNESVEIRLFNYNYEGGVDDSYTDLVTVAAGTATEIKVKVDNYLVDGELPGFGFAIMGGPEWNTELEDGTYDRHAIVLSNVRLEGVQEQSFDLNGAAVANGTIGTGFAWANSGGVASIVDGELVITGGYRYDAYEITFGEESEPEVTEPEVTEPEVSEPEATEPTKPTPSENVVFSVVTDNETTHHEYASEMVSAISGVSGSATVILYQDVNLGSSYITVAAGQNIVLDLNGCTLTTSKSSGGVISVSGSLTVQDTSAEGDGLISNTATSSDRAIVVATSTGSLTVKSGNFTTKTQAIRIDNGSAIIEGGNISATNYAVYCSASGSLTISGGYLASGSGSFYYPAYAGTGATVSITGGYFAGNIPGGSGLNESISGGYYIAEPKAAHLVSGCTVESNDDATYIYKVVDPNATTEPEEPVLGSQENPVLIYSMGATIEATAGQTVYCQSFVGGMIMTIAGEGEFSVVYGDNTYTSENGTLTTTAINGSMMMPVTFTLVNGNADATYTVSFAAPVGSMDNPDTLVMDYNYADIAAGSQGYYYTWTAEEAGILTISMPESIGWTYTINNMTAGTYGDTQWSDSDPVVNPAVVEVAAGDQLQIIVNTYDPADVWNNPAAELAIYASFNTLPGTEGNPIWFEDSNAETASIEDQMTVPAGATQYYTGRVGGLTMTVNGEAISISYNGAVYTPVDGVITINVVNAGFFAPTPVFAVTNTGADEATYDVVFSYPVGSFENPAELVMDKNTASVAEGGAGYYYTWTAEEEGKLTIEMTSSNWTYVINNNTQYVYGNNHASDDETVIAKETVAVKPGDEIQIVIGTADYAAAEVTLIASFKDNTVAKIGDTTYEDITSALAAAKPNETVELLVDAEADYVVITPGVTLNLGSYSLTANYVIGLQGSFVTANIEGATEGVAGGKLIVAQNKISLSSAAPNADGNWKVLPVWMDGYYVFAKAQIYAPTFTVDAAAGTASVDFYPTFNQHFKSNVFNDGCEDNDVSIIINVTYMEGDIKVTKEYYYTTPMVQKAMQNMSMTASMDGCNALTNLVFSIAIVTSSGVEITSQNYVYNDYI